MAGFTSATDNNPIISEETHIIEDEEVPYYKPVNPWKEGETTSEPQLVSMDLNKSDLMPMQSKGIPI